MTPAAAKLIGAGLATIALAGVGIGIGDRKSTRLNSSHRT